jgi:hypothetical protein
MGWMHGTRGADCSRCRGTTWPPSGLYRRARKGCRRLKMQGRGSGNHGPRSRRVERTSPPWGKAGNHGLHSLQWREAADAGPREAVAGMGSSGTGESRGGVGRPQEPVRLPLGCDGAGAGRRLRTVLWLVEGNRSTPAAGTAGGSWGSWAGAWGCLEREKALCEIVVDFFSRI